MPFRFSRFASGCFMLSVATALFILGLSPKAAYAQAENGATFTPLYLFGSSGSTDAQNPYGAPVSGADGDYYGTTYIGGAYDGGAVYKISPSGAETVIYSFGAADANGYSPYSPLTLGPNGNFYGTTMNGGANYSGTVFMITPNGTETVLHSFAKSTDGYLVESGLVLGSDGNFYGTAAEGGTYGDGTVFRMTPSGVFTTLNNFSGTDGSNPYFALVQGSDGNFYGTTSVGGTHNLGTIFKITPTGEMTTLYSFSGTDGQEPYCRLISGPDGELYGTTSFAGAGGTGTIFKITLSGSLTTLYSFSPYSNSNADGAYPLQGLYLGSDGNFYGATTYGGTNDTGTVFQITPSGTLTTLYNFSADDGGGNSDGSRPQLNGFSEGSDGTLYGTCDSGGINNQGTFFEMTVPSLSDATRFDFNKDGHSDLVWYNTGTGGVSVWDMNDQTVLSYGATFAALAPSSGWLPVATPDINDDGSPDLLWWNSRTGELSFWTLNNTNVTQFYSDFATVSDTDWKPMAAADVTGSTWELVFQNTATGALSAWDMNGQTVTKYGPTLATLGAGTPYQVVGAPDMDGDGKSDLLFWNDQTGGVSYWSCNLAASQVLAYHPDFTSLSDTSWHLVGSEDTNGDGHPDLLWWNKNTGEVSRWLLNGTTVTQYGGDSAKVPDTTWQPTAIR